MKNQKKRLANKVLLIGWDGADWKIINPLLNAGKMPALESLVNNGVMGNIATLDPPLSPILWTSIATGKLADKHGILGFSEPAPNLKGIQPVTITARKVKAIWNILTQNGFKSNVIGWWPSHPAEPINGVSVSNFYKNMNPAPGKAWGMPKGCIHPQRLEKTLKDLRIEPIELTDQHLLPFVPRAAEVDQNKDQKLYFIAKTIAEAATIHAAATWVMENEEWDFMAVYYDAIDHFSHGFMNFHPPRMNHIPEDQYEMYKDVIDGAYIFHDMMLERLLQLAGDDTTVLLLSDHGFHSDHLRPVELPKEPAGPAHQHRHYGILCIKGPHILKDERIYGARLLDIAPTVLTLFGLPVGGDMDGFVLKQAFDRDIEIDTIPSWELVDGECGTHPPNMQMDPMANQEILEQLIELGYIEKPDENVQKSIENTVNESKFYLARVYLYKKDYLNALPLLEELFEKDSTQTRYSIYLAKCYQSLKRIKECRQILEKMSLPVRNETPLLLFMQGALSFEEKDFESALHFLSKAEAYNPRLSSLHNQIGAVYLKMMRLEEAKRAFEKGLTIDPENAQTHCGLAEIHFRLRQFDESAEYALQTVGLIFYNHSAHYWLGASLVELGFFERAAEAFEVSLSMAPRLKEAREQLIDLYERELHLPELAQRHRILAEEIELQRIVNQSSFMVPKTMKIEPERTPPPPQKRFGNDCIYVVSGLPRSGTSLMMQMLQRGGMDVLTDELRKADENNIKGYFEYERVKNLFHDSSWLGEAQNKAVKIISHLLTSLPSRFNYRIVFLERNIDEVIRSQEKMLQLSGVKSKDPELLKETYTRQLSQLKSWLEEQENMEVLYISHHEIMENPYRASETVNEFLKLNLNIESMALAVDSTLYRQRLQPLKRG